MIGLKLLRCEGSPPVWTKVISAENQEDGGASSVRRIFVNNVARK